MNKVLTRVAAKLGRVPIWIIVALIALGLIGTGLFLIYPPACPLGIGLIIWFDLMFTPGGKR